MPKATNPKVAKSADVVEAVVKATGLSQKDARAAVKATFESTAKLLKKNDRVTLTGVGSFSKKVKPAQKGGKKAVNPFTGETYTTKAKPKTTKVVFRPGKGFKDHVA